MKAAPIAPVYDAESGLLHTLPDFQRAQVWNPMIEPVLRGAHNKSANYRMAGNIYGELDLMKNLTFKATFSWIMLPASHVLILRLFMCITRM